MNTAVAEAHGLGWRLAWVEHGWAGPALLDTYEAEWRPIGARRAARSAQEGPEPDGAEALAEDLNGRLPHAWLPGGDGPRRSTLDLLGPGLTLLTGPDAPVRPSLPGLPVPLTVHTVDATTAQVLGIGPVGAVLVRPDAQVAARWSTAPADPRAELAAVVPGRPEPAGSRR